MRTFVGAVFLCAFAGAAEAEDLAFSLPVQGAIDSLTPTASLGYITGNLPSPGVIAFGPNGDLYSANDDVIKQTSRTGNSTFAEPGGYLEGLAFDPTGNLYAANAAGTIYKITPAGSVSTFATLTEAITGVTGMTMGPNGNLYVAYRPNYGDVTISVITPSGFILTAYKYTAPNGFVGEVSGGVAVDPNGDLFFGLDSYTLTGVERNNFSIEEVSAAGSEFTYATLSDSPGAPLNLTLDPMGNLFFTTQSNSVYECSTAGSISTFYSFPNVQVNVGGLAFIPAGAVPEPAAFFPLGLGILAVACRKRGAR